MSGDLLDTALPIIGAALGIIAAAAALTIWHVRDFDRRERERLTRERTATPERPR